MNPDPSECRRRMLMDCPRFTLSPSKPGLDGRNSVKANAQV